MTPDQNELVVLVDEHDNELGTMEKLAAHQNGGHLHRAVSVLLTDARARLLLQRRAPTKYHFPGRWANTCCTHPRPGESPRDAALRRLRHEMGLEADLTPAGTFLYEATDKTSGLTEREFDHVFTGIAPSDPTPNPEEADAFEWITPDQLAESIRADPDRYCPWLPHVLETLRTANPDQGATA